MRRSGRGQGSKARLRNIDLARDAAIDHLNIEKNDKLHAEAIAAIQGLARRRHRDTHRAVLSAAGSRGVHKSEKQ